MYEKRGASSDSRRQYRSAAEQGYATGRPTRLMYMNGKARNKDIKEALKWLNLAAEQDHAPPSTYRLAVRERDGVKKNVKKAVEWYRRVPSWATRARRRR